VSAGPTRSGVTWAQASETLAARVARRARQSAAFTHIGTTLLVAAGLAVLWRAVGPRLPGLSGVLVVGLLLGLGLTVGLLLALRAARRVQTVGSEDAAWALDRLARTEGRGLAAAAARGPAASEAAFAAGGLEAPPVVRLHPPDGLARGVGALLLSVLALLAPDGGAGPEEAETASGGVLVGGEGETGGSAASARAEQRAQVFQAQADAAREVRTALNLPRDGPLDSKDVAERLKDPEARRKAAEAAASGSDLAGALNGPDISADAVARLIERGGDNLAAASRERREAAGARARLGLPAVPPARRDVVQRYLQLIDREGGG
jgi:hypothetical protein